MVILPSAGKVSGQVTLPSFSKVPIADQTAESAALSTALDLQ